MRSANAEIMNEGICAICTSVYKIPRRDFAFALVRRHCGGWIFLFAALIALSSVCAVIYDSRWIIVAFMILFIVSPMILAFLYFHHGLKQVSVANVVSHNLSFSQDSLEIAVFPEMKETDDTCDINSVPKTCRTKVEYRRISKIDATLSGLEISVGDGKDGFICLPKNVFGSDDDFSRAVDIMTEGIRNLSQNK